MSRNSRSRELVSRPQHLLAPEMDYILVDASASMADKWSDIQASLDSYLATIRAAALHSHGIVSTFGGSDDIGYIQRDGIVGDWLSFKSASLYMNSGMTALYDAVNLMGRELAHFSPEKCSIVIVTDGDENASQHTSQVQARAILDWCRAQGWQVTFLGADFDNDEQAKMLGADPSTNVGVQKHLLGQAGKDLGEKRTRYSRTGADIGYTGDEKVKFGGYLSKG